MKILLIDNYDSFTFNLVQYLQILGATVIVHRNDEIDISFAQNLQPNALIFSPGPGSVENIKDVGIGPSLLDCFRGKIPILGVCLGEQMIGRFFGGKIELVAPVHGKRCKIKILEKKYIFKEFPDEIVGMRYHSMVVSRNNFPHDILNITAETNDNNKLIMALEKSDELIFGLQFHPESIGTKMGIDILRNFYKLI